MIKYVNVDDLQKLAINAEKFGVIVEHAKTCKIPGELYIHYSPSSEKYVAVVFDVVGCVRGLVNVDRQFVPADDFAEADKVAAHKMVMSAFQHKKDIQQYVNEASTSDFPAQVPNDVNNSISPGLGSPSGSNMGPNETTDGLAFPTLSPPLTTINDEDSCFEGYYCSETEMTDLWHNDNFLNDILQFADDHRIEAHNIQNTGADVYKGSSADSSRKAKGRWKRVVISVRLTFTVMSVRKKIEAHAHKKQRLC